MRKATIRMLVFIAVLFIAGCSLMRPPPVREVKGPRVVCILFNEKRFKIEVVGRLTGVLSRKGFQVVIGSVKDAKYYKPGDYGAVVYMAELWAWHTPLHAKRYYKNNHQPGNVVFVVTSAVPDVVIKKPFDAVTSASRPDKAEPVAQEIMVRLDTILEK